MQRTRTRAVSLTVLACFMLPCGVNAAQQQQRDPAALFRSIEWTFGPAEVDLVAISMRSEAGQARNPGPPELPRG